LKRKFFRDSSGKRAFERLLSVSVIGTEVRGGQDENDGNRNQQLNQRKR